ncbi:imm11 family protein [Falsiroseomonas sp.]|uniref:imm11 family protein n=1 Tax=Falsiroseomonas sp. TaxID=2870721 RepID=UPI003F729496
MTETPTWIDPSIAYLASRAAADARYAGTAMRRYSEMRVTLRSTCIRGDKPVLTYPARGNPAHPPLSGDNGEAGWGGGRGWDRLRTPEAMASPIRLQSRARQAEQIGDIVKSEFLGNMIIVSKKAAALMREFEPDGVDTFPIEITLATGELVPEGRFHLFEATRDIPAVDLEASGWRWMLNMKGRPILTWPSPTDPDEPDVPMYILRDEVLPDSVHLFRDRRFHGGGPIWVSNALREAMVAQGITNPSFSWGDRIWHTMALEPQRRRRKGANTIRVVGCSPPAGRAGDTAG